MKLIMGLGNPGEKYSKTRHNLGFMVVEQFLKDFEPVEKTVWHDEPKFKSSILELEWQPKQGKLEKIILVKPKTYMNNSGLAVKLLISYFLASRSGSLLTSDVWIVHDDLDLPFCSIKIRFGGAGGGHKGVESIIESLGTDKFWRFRMGIGKQDQRSSANWRIKDQKIQGVEDYVLSSFTKGEKGKAREMIKKGSDAIQLVLEEGLEKAMNRYNTK